MTTKGEENLARMFAREMRAAARSAAFMLKAEQEGREDLASLFGAAADAKSVHARRFLNLMRGKIKGSQENLKEAFESESYGLAELYPGMVQETRNSPAAVRKGFVQSMKTDAELVGLYQEAMKGPGTGETTVYYVCQICGHIHRNSIPRKCPVCKAVPGRFKRAE
ncbi:MAG: rubrerythrin family protein [Desulfobacterota bacterium]|nr:rubrerythrin family protein [Thermodesulfobacteriota bacterium]